MNVIKKDHHRKTIQFEDIPIGGEFAVDSELFVKITGSYDAEGNANAFRLTRPCAFRFSATDTVYMVRATITYEYEYHMNGKPSCEE